MKATTMQPLELRHTISWATRLARRTTSTCLALGWLVVTACGARVDAGDHPASSQTHWLQACDSDATCGDLECVCGVCTKPCERNAACSDLGAESVCSRISESCGGGSAADVCTKKCSEESEDEQCGALDECIEGVCRHPESTEPVPEPTSTPLHDAGQTPLDASSPASPLSLGQACESDGQCESGACRSATCSDADAVCVPTEATCNADLVQYCGCDGVTFQGSSGGPGCAGARYAYEGPCGSGTQPAGARCNVHDDCESGICEGVGCGDFEGVCAAEERTCTDDLRNFCDCDGNMFWASSSCPGERHREETDCPYKAMDGDPCEAHDDCASGICEGEGCDVPGRCASRDRICTDDLQPYCGCDGVWFFGSSTCPGGRYDDALECKAPDGEACTTHEDCVSGICEGLGCEAGQGVCAASERGCTEDEVAYCTCEGVTVYGSGSCPGVRYASEGECD